MKNDTAPPDAAAFKSLRYLTIQDILWINLQATKKVQHFNYGKLEEATFYQYGYGASRDPGKQAARFLTGFLKLHPFDAGNEATAFIGFAAFLLMNGGSLRLSDDEGPAWFAKVRDGETDPQQALAVFSGGTEPHAAEIREAVPLVLERFPKTVSTLSESGSSARVSA